MILILDQQGTIGMLKELFEKYGCDKAKKHSYDRVYEAEFQGMRTMEINFLEIGIFRGQSIQAWLDFFPKATIYAADTFQRIDPKDIPVLQHERVKWIRCDSTKTNTRELIETVWPDTKFDIILDDGLHTPRANGQTFNVFYPLLKENGMYFIEDVWPLHIMSKEQKEHWWLKKYPERYADSEMDYFLDQIPITTKVVEFDLRDKSGEPDSYIMKIDK